MKVSRRAVLKGSAAAFLGAAGNVLNGCSAGADVTTAPEKEKGTEEQVSSAEEVSSLSTWVEEDVNEVPDETVYSWCRQCVLPPCGIKVKVKDGVATSVEGNPKCPTNHGKLCARGNATLAGVYNPYRVKKPMKRTNPKKGLQEDPGWVEISWEEAYDTVAAKMKQVREKDPRRFVWNNGFARSGSMIEGMEFCQAFGTPNYIEVDGPTCSLHFGCSLLVGNFTGPVHDPNYTNYLIVMGKGEYATDAYAPGSAAFAGAIARGMKVVSVDPRCNVEAAKGEWVPIKPGTDLAFILAMQYTILYEIGKTDEEFLKNRTNAPYLIGPDGHYVREGESGKPLLWDMTEGKPKVFDDSSLADAALEGSYTVNGVDCVPAFRLYKESLANYTPEWASAITTIPAETIRRISSEFVEAAQIGSTVKIGEAEMPYRPVCLELGRGAATQFYGGNCHASSIILHMLVGALDVPGGGIGSLGPAHKCTPIPRALAPDEDGIVAPKVEAVHREFEWPPNRLDGKTFFPFSHDNPHLAYDAILHPEEYSLDYTPEVMMIWGGNPILRIYDPEKIVEALKKIDFIFTVSYSLDEPTFFADIVFPEADGLERYAAATRPGMLETEEGRKKAIAAVAAQQVIEPVYDSRQPDEIFLELAERIGILYGENGLMANFIKGTLSPVAFSEGYIPDINRRYTPKELADLVIKSAVGPEYDTDRMRNSDEVPMNLLPEAANYPYASFPMGTTRYALYLEKLFSEGEALIANLKAVNAKMPGDWTPELLEDYYTPTIGWKEKRKKIPEEYDLYAFNWKTPQHSFGNGGSAENPWLNAAADLDPFLHKICLNAKTAQERGLKDGDRVRVEAYDSGKSLEGEVKTTQTIHPETVGISGLFGHVSTFMNPEAAGGLHFNRLMADTAGDIDPLGGGFDGSHRVKLIK